jgi:hypothetical protein
MPRHSVRRPTLRAPFVLGALALLAACAPDAATAPTPDGAATAAPATAGAGAYLLQLVSPNADDRAVRLTLRGLVDSVTSARDGIGLLVDVDDAGLTSVIVTASAGTSLARGDAPLLVVWPRAAAPVPTVDVEEAVQRTTLHARDLSGYAARITSNRAAP